MIFHIVHLFIYIILNLYNFSFILKYYIIDKNYSSLEFRLIKHRIEIIHRLNNRFFKLMFI